MILDNPTKARKETLIKGTWRKLSESIANTARDLVVVNPHAYHVRAHGAGRSPCHVNLTLSDCVCAPGCETGRRKAGRKFSLTQISVYEVMLFLYSK